MHQAMGQVIEQMEKKGIIKKAIKEDIRSNKLEPVTPI
jgi:hypothetical protein